MASLPILITKSINFQVICGEHIVCIPSRTDCLIESGSLSLIWVKTELIRSKVFFILLISSSHKFLLPQTVSQNSFPNSKGFLGCVPSTSSRTPKMPTHVLYSGTAGITNPTKVLTQAGKACPKGSEHLTCPRMSEAAGSKATASRRLGSSPRRELPRS